MYGRINYLLGMAQHTLKKQGVPVFLYFLFVEYPICNVFRNVHYLFMKRKSSNIKEIQGSLMALDLNDKGISRDLLQFGIRERTSTKIMQGILGAGQVVVDIGANIGYYVLIEAKAGATVYAVEPAPNNFKTLSNNIMLNNYKNVETYQMAIGGKENETLKMIISEKSNLSSITRDNIPGAVEVKSTTLDYFLRDKKLPDIVRMDVEGYEYEIIKGMTETLKIMREGSWLFMEIHDIGQKKKDEIFGVLKENNFVVKKKIKECKESPVFSYLTYRSKFRLNFPVSGVYEYFFRKESIY